MGLYTTADLWPAFRWEDRSPSPNITNYMHWGWYLPDIDSPDRIPEPNNLLIQPEFCAGGNATEAYGKPLAWGWADYNCDQSAPFMCKMQPPLVAYCPLALTGNTYILNTTATEYWAAEAVCNVHGGHLVAYSDLAEQQQVEQCFISQGTLLPAYHKFYWMGLATGNYGAKWPNFTWIDHNKAIYVGQYQHWGLYSTRAGASFEPNNLRPPENCAGANLTTSWLAAGGWADHHCRERYTFICEVAPPMPSRPYTASTGNAFRFYATPLNKTDAEVECNMYGGHLASYLSLAEQAEVEQWYMDNGDLLPTFTPSYWIGLSSTNGTWPSFRWLDDAPPPTGSAYQHWGVDLYDGSSEPNSQGNCVVANYSQSADSPATFGWSDTRCNQKLPFMCRRMPPGAYVYIISANSSDATGAAFEVAQPGGVITVGTNSAGKVSISAASTSKTGSSGNTATPAATASTSKRPPPPAKAAAAIKAGAADDGGNDLVATYVSDGGATFILNTTASTFMVGEQVCNDQGGHLVWFNNLAEQAEVEAFFLSKGVFIPLYHKFYWIGLRAATWPNFQWM
jgi:hypothetical protein